MRALRLSTTTPRVRPFHFSLLLTLISQLIMACDSSPLDPIDTIPTAVEEETSFDGQASPPARIAESVGDLTVSATEQQSVTLSWTEVADDHGNPASYEIRYAPSLAGQQWQNATVASTGSCASPVNGSKVGARFVCTAMGLDQGVSYDFQVSAFRMATSGQTKTTPTTSNVVTATTYSDVPGSVTDLSARAASSTSAAVSWTQVDDGMGTPALYEVRHTLSPMNDSWGEATVVVAGDCAAPMSGTEVGAALTCTVEGLEAGRTYDLRLVAFRVEQNGARTYSAKLSNVASVDTPEESVPAGPPARVSDLTVADVDVDAVRLSWTQVDDGLGAPAFYQVRYARTPIGYGWGDAHVVTSGDCAAPIAPSTLDAKISCTVGGLDSSASYDFQLVAFRTEEDGSRIYSAGLSNVATGVTDGDLADTHEPETGDDGGDPGTGAADQPAGDDGGDPGTGTDPVPDPSTPSASHEPAAFSTLVETSYGAAREGGFSSSNNENFSIVSDPSAPFSPGSVAQAKFPAGLGDGVSPIWSAAGIAQHGARRLYISFWMKVSDNWQGHETAVNKVAILWTHEKPVVVANMNGVGAGRLMSEIRIQDVPDGARNLTANVGPAELTRGVWHRWEIVLISNSGGSADGQVTWWIDGNKAGEYNDVRFGTSAQSKIWDNVTWRPVWGGRGDTVREDMYMWMDHYYASGSE